MIMQPLGASVVLLDDRDRPQRSRMSANRECIKKPCNQRGEGLGLVKAVAGAVNSERDLLRLRACVRCHRERTLGELTDLGVFELTKVRHAEKQDGIGAYSSGGSDEAMVSGDGKVELPEPCERHNSFIEAVERLGMLQHQEVSWVREGVTFNDSEFDVGDYWHAARLLLRSSGPRRSRLMLARALRQPADARYSPAASKVS